MMQYLYNASLSRQDMGEESRTLSYLSSYINRDKDLDLKIEEAIPIIMFGQEDDSLRILGSTRLLQVYDDLDAEKLDFIETLGNISFQGIENKGTLTLSFPQMEIDANSIYNAYSDFLGQFDITRFVNYCCKQGYDDLININISQLLERHGEDEKQFRLLRTAPETWGIRAVTSKTYKNYDNNIVLYLSFLAAHRHAYYKDIWYYVQSAFISDSYINISLEKSAPVFVPNVGNVYLGLSISNSEIRNYTFSVGLRYRVDNPNNKQFAAIYKTPLFSLKHSSSIQKTIEQLDRFTLLEQYESAVIEFLTQVGQVNQLTNDAAYNLFDNLLTKVKFCTDISSGTKDRFKSEETRLLISNAVSIIDALDKARTIPTDMDERVFVERIFHDVIDDLISRRNRRRQNQ